MVLSDATPNPSSALELRQVEKSYGDLPVLRGLDMTVNEGEIYGFLGRNGAGKSTALRIIMGVTQAQVGGIHLFGESVKGTDPLPRRQIGYVAQEQHFYGWMTALRIGRFVAGFYPTWDEAGYRHLLEALEVPTDRKIDGFSGGMTAKLALCLALASQPKLLLLDEPTAGMDAVARREFLALVRDEAVRAHRTILFSSHLIDEVELAADKVGILDEGVMRFEGSLTTLQQTVKRYVRKTGTATADELRIPGAQVLSERVYDDRKELIIQFSDATPTPQRTELFANHNGWRVEQPSLEDIFIAMVGKTFEL